MMQRRKTIKFTTDELVVEKVLGKKLVEHSRALRLVFNCDQSSFLIYADT